MTAYIMTISGAICLSMGSMALCYRLFLSATGWFTTGIVLVVLAYLKAKKVWKKNVACKYCRLKKGGGRWEH